jgi:phosphatidate cytidylyltransferase
MLKTRILTALVLIPGFVAALFLLPEPYWSLLMLAVASVGIWEWAQMIKFTPLVRHIYVSATVIIGLIFVLGVGKAIPQLREYGMFFGILAAALFWVVLAPIWLISRYHIKNLAVMAAVGWLVILPTWLAFVALRGISPWLLVGVIAAVWIADSAAYFFGKRFGKHKLAPLISPGKTWEGVLGAWLAVSVYGLGVCLLLRLDFWIIVGFWGIVVLSIMGDLLESLIKRQAGVKDSSDLLPGHGGVLDRIDGLTSSLPLVVFFIYFPMYYRLCYMFLSHHG